MFKWIKKLFHKHEWTEPLIVSGYGYTEYEIWFCTNYDCSACQATLTKKY